MSHRDAAVVLAVVVAMAAFSGKLEAQRRGRGPQGGNTSHVLPSMPKSTGPQATFRESPIRSDHRMTVSRSRSSVLLPQNYGGGYVPYYPYAPQPLLPYPIYVEPATARQNAEVVIVEREAERRNDDELISEVRRLTREIEQIRSEQPVAPVAPPVLPQPVPPSAPKTFNKSRMLVFRDGRHLAIQNYAVTGDALWIMDENASKVLLSDLDLDATEQANPGQNLRLPRYQK